MKLDATDFRLLNGHFYQATPKNLVVDFIGHKTSQFNSAEAPVNGAFVYLNEARRSELHAQQYGKGFNLKRWLEEHIDKVNLLVTETPIEGVANNIVQFIVPNTWEFYKEVVAYARKRYFGNVITVTGSVGKSTTRLMIVEMLKALNHKVVTNIGNENVRMVTVPLLANTLRNPDELVAEISINALNNRDKKGGPVSRLYQANAAVITQIGGAHLADIQNVPDPLMFLAERKARIFEGLNENSRAIINYDMEPRIYKYAVSMAQKKTEHVFSYSEHNQHADAYVLKQDDYREYSIVTLQVLDEVKEVKLTMPGTGIIMDLLGACLTLKTLGIALPRLKDLFINFQALNSELKFHQLKTDKGQLTLVDDTHGSTIHSVENVLSVFKTRGPFYKGNKVLIMETGEDLGDNAVEYNMRFKDPIVNSHIDMLWGYRDDAIKPLIESLDSNLSSAHYSNLDDLQAVVKELPDDSLVIVKSSDGRKYGSDLWTLPDKLLF